jgi:hypothetical protein
MGVRDANVKCCGAGPDRDFHFDRLTFVLVSQAAKFCLFEVEVSGPFSPEAAF